MPVLRFRIYWDEDESVYRDIAILSGQTFLDLHEAILASFEFDTKHEASFFRSNDHWQRGREILLKTDEHLRQAPPLLMQVTTLAAIIRSPNEKFVYLYDYQKQWVFLVELIAVMAERKTKESFPYCIRKEGPAPSQYGNKKHIKDQLVETEEQYDLNNEDSEAGYGEEGEESSGETGETGAGEGDDFV